MLTSTSVSVFSLLRRVFSRHLQWVLTLSILILSLEVNSFSNNIAPRNGYLHGYSATHAKSGACTNTGGSRLVLSYNNNNNHEHIINNNNANYNSTSSILPPSPIKTKRMVIGRPKSKPKSKSKRGMESITKTANILAKRIVHRGVAVTNNQLRLMHRLRIREREEQEQKQEQEQLKEQERMQQRQKENEKKQKSVKTMKDILDLQWSIDKNNQECDVTDILSCSTPCTTCRGHGRHICQFCKGVGYIDFGDIEGNGDGDGSGNSKKGFEDGTIGKKMEKKNGGHLGVECPVCDEDGEDTCKDCNGSGWIAKWKNGDDN